MTRARAAGRVTRRDRAVTGLRSGRAGSRSEAAAPGGAVTARNLRLFSTHSSGARSFRRRRPQSVGQAELTERAGGVLEGGGHSPSEVRRLMLVSARCGGDGQDFLSVAERCLWLSVTSWDEENQTGNSSIAGKQVEPALSSLLMALPKPTLKSGNSIGARSADSWS